jgi:hypothetical protein
MRLSQLKTFEGACKLLKLDSKKVIPTFRDYPAPDRKAMIAHAKLVIITKAANQIASKRRDWTPDWNNGQWDKWYPWFEMGGSSGFRFSGSGDLCSDSRVGSRLCFFSKEAAEHVGKTFEELYKEYFVM